MSVLPGYDRAMSDSTRDLQSAEEALAHARSTRQRLDAHRGQVAPADYRLVDGMNDVVYDMARDRFGWVLRLDNPTPTEAAQAHYGLAQIAVDHGQTSVILAQIAALRALGEPGSNYLNVLLLDPALPVAIRKVCTPGSSGPGLGV